jgi:hypothetical protein
VEVTAAVNHQRIIVDKVSKIRRRNVREFGWSDAEQRTVPDFNGAVVDKSPRTRAIRSVVKP